MTVEQFLEQEAQRRGVSAGHLRRRYIAVSCVCGQQTCDGWTLRPRNADRVMLDRHAYRTEEDVREQLRRSHPKRVILALTRYRVHHGQLLPARLRAPGRRVWVVDLEPRRLEPEVKPERRRMRTQDEARELEQKIADLWIAGLPRHEIAAECGVGPNTVTTYVHRMRERGVPIPRRAPGTRGEKVEWLDPVPKVLDTSLAAA
ncbi:MAG: hypothetical protein PGN13_16510 [Patulibacter minatonensis]